MIRKKVFGIVCAAVTSIMLLSTITTVSAVEESKTSNGQYSIGVTGYDWGPAVNKAVITLDKEVDEVNKDKFKVKEIKNWYNGIQEFDRTINNAYLSDANGKEVKGASKYITIEMKVAPNEGSPFIYSFKTGTNNWTNPYKLKISLKEGQALKRGDKEITSVNINDVYVKKTLGSVDKFKESIYSKEGDITLSYAHYEPKEDNKKNPLVIWLHGAGEGGVDTTIDTLGNKVGALVEDKIQSKFGGAYVLAPQSPTMWMDHTGKAEYTNDGSSIYVDSLLNLIKSYVSSNPDIDTDRIYIGGCSNGGYMTLAILFKDPQYFTAAYPICEAYADSWITDDQINSIKNVPIWFTYAKNDGTVNPKLNSAATIERLAKAGSADLHKSVFDNVVDTSGLYKDEKGNPYEYPGHWSWIYAFNDECKDGEESLWNWLAKQTKAVPEKDSRVEEKNKGQVKGEEASGIKSETKELKGEANNDKAPKTSDPLTLEAVLGSLLSAGAVLKFRKIKK